MAIARSAAAPIAMAAAEVRADQKASRTSVTRSDAAREPSRAATSASPAARTRRLNSARSPPDRASPPGTMAATPVNARNATRSTVTSSDVRSSVVSAARPRLIRLSSSSVRSTMNQVTPSAGTSHNPKGTSRIAPRQATAATDGRMTDSIGTPNQAWTGAASSWRTWSVPRSMAPRSAAAHSQMSGGSSRRDRPTSVTATSARSRRAGRSSMPAMVREALTASSHAAGLAGDPGEEVGARPGIQDDIGGDPGTACLADAPADVVHLADVVRIGVDRDETAEPDRPPRPLDGEVQPRRRSVHLEGGPGPGGLRVDEVPVEIEVVALADLPTRGMGDDVDVRAPDRVQRPLGQLRPALSPADVDGRDDEVEACEQVVVEVERAVGADLELAAVEEAEAFGRGRGRRGARGLLSRVPLVERGDDVGLLRDPVRGEPAGDGKRLRVVGQDLIGVAAPPGVLGHDLDRVVAVGPVGVAVQVPAQVRLGDERRQAAGEGSLDLPGVLAQLGLDERQAEECVRVGLGREGAQLRVVTGERLAVLPDAQEALLGQAPAEIAGHRPEPDVVLLGPGEVDTVGPCLARRHHHQVRLRPAHDPDGGLVATLVDDRVDHAESREGIDQRHRLVGLGEDVEIADRLLSPAERACRLHRADAGCPGEPIDEACEIALGLVESHALEAHLEPCDALQDERLRLRRHPADRPEAPLLGRATQIVDGLDPELRVELSDRLGAESRDVEDLDEGRWDLCAQPLVHGHVAGRDDLPDLVRDGLADARDRR